MPEGTNNISNVAVLTSTVHRCYSYWSDVTGLPAFVVDLGHQDLGVSGSLSSSPKP